VVDGRRVLIDGRCGLGAAVPIFPMELERAHAMVAVDALENAAVLDACIGVMSHDFHCSLLSRKFRGTLVTKRNARGGPYQGMASAVPQWNSELRTRQRFRKNAGPAAEAYFYKRLYGTPEAAPLIRILIPANFDLAESGFPNHQQD
jgi:hypothetical protein